VGTDWIRIPEQNFLGADMKFLLLSDTHIRATSPEGRIDDFRKVQARKWRGIIDAYHQNNCDAILQAGDFWNEPSPPYGLVYEFLEMFSRSKIKVYTVMGQHDMYMRSSDIRRTANGNLSLHGIIDILDGTPVTFEENNGMVCIYGISYDRQEDFHEIEFSLRKSDHNILVIHDDIGDKPLYPGHNLLQAEDVLQGWKEFNLILCGDYHYPYIFEDSGRYIVNTGCLLRMTRNDRDMYRKPHFYIYDTLNNEPPRKMYIPISKVSQTFDLRTKLSSEEENRDIQELVSKLRKQGKIGLSYLDNLRQYYKDNEVKESVKALIDEAIE
jgi:DNA repair protein SbcD/Mre11